MLYNENKNITNEKKKKIEIETGRWEFLYVCKDKDFLASN